MNLNDDSIMNDANIIMTPPTPTNRRRFGRLREHMAHQPRSVSLRDFDTIKEDDAPVTPPSISKIHPVAMTQPPEVRRHGRPINRRLMFSSQEAQERLSLPDLFAPRNQTPTIGRRVRAVPKHPSRPSLMPIQPRMGQDGYYNEPPLHSMSQRSFFSNMNPAEF